MFRPGPGVRLLLSQKMRPLCTSKNACVGIGVYQDAHKAGRPRQYRRGSEGICDDWSGAVVKSTPVLPGALNSPSGFFPLIGTVADMAKGPSRLGAEELPVLLRPKLDGLLRPKVDAGLPLGGASFLSPVSRLAAPRSPF